MARLSSERLRLHINDIIQWDSDGIEGIYESFDIKLTINGREAIYGVNGSYELCGNIEMLIIALTDVLEGQSTYEDIEFTEPDFRF
jgi:hypothetical protein